MYFFLSCTRDGCDTGGVGWQGLGEEAGEAAGEESGEAWEEAGEELGALREQVILMAIPGASIKNPHTQNPH